MNYRQMAKKLGVKGESIKKQISQTMLDLAQEGRLQEISRGRFIYTSKGTYITGVVDLTARGSAFIISDELEEDVFVSHKNLNHALDTDTVKIFLYAKRAGKQPEGEVVEILQRKKTEFVGTLELSSGFAFVTADSNKMPYDIFVPIKDLKKAQDGQKVIAHITDWPAKAKSPIGEITQILGWPGENETEMVSIMAEFDLPYHFPEKVLKDAEKISEKISQTEIAKRRDFRDITTFTIDPADAKDCDDALSIQKIKDDKWEIGIHIADVSHYVEPNSILDKEAINRATSVYLVDRVVPMLPERLSNNICSLRPNEDKLCFSAVFHIDKDAKIRGWGGDLMKEQGVEITKHQEAQDIIESKTGDLADEILQLDTIAKKLREKRFKKGSMAFDKVEMKFKLDEDGKPLGVYFKESKDANKLIEEFMLLANKKVAEFIGKTPKEKKPKTFVYRIHDLPNQEKLFDFSSFIERFGYRMNLSSPQNISNSINSLLENVKGKPEQNVVETLAIRSMAKAEYSTENIGHYGLSFDYYTHFTSPIRRYPDVMVHRLLFAYLNKENSKSQEKYEELCEISSKQERMAAKAERASVKYKQVEFMQDKVGEEFEGVISGVSEWGIYIELDEYKTEGMVRIKDITNDHYYFDEKNYCLIGDLYKRKYQLGDKVKIIVVKANLEKKHLDFLLVEE